MKRFSIITAASAITLAAVIAGSIALGAAPAESREQTSAASQPTATVPANDANLPPVPLTGFTIAVNGKLLEPDALPYLAGDTMLVPLRALTEALGAVVSYNETAGSIIAVKDGSSIVLIPGDSIATKNGTPVQLAAAPVRDGDVVLVPLRFFAEAFGTSVKWDGAAKRVTVESEDYLLPAIGSYAKLKELLASAQDQGITIGPGHGMQVFVMEDSAVARSEIATSAAQKQNASAAPKGDFSATNVQVQGVDEGDVVKTDGEFIYQVNGSRVMIVRAAPEDKMTLESVLQLEEKTFAIQELYVDGDRLTVIGSSSRKQEPQNPDVSSAKESLSVGGTAAKRRIAPAAPSTVKTLVYDIADRKAPKLLREVETEGSYVSSRRIGGEVYVIANRYLNRYGIIQDNRESAAVPAYRDTAMSGQWTEAKYEDIRYFPDSLYSAYLVVAGISTASPSVPAEVSIYLGSAENVFASADHLYAAFPRRQVSEDRVKPAAGTSADVAAEYIRINVDETTQVYKFRLDKGKASFAAKGQVPGTVLNQFSMDEHNGYFRIATTKGKEWGRAGEKLTNNVYVLNEDMGISGQIEGIAPGESIYSVRFMGNRGYMVTFQKVDPLFVLDFSNPASPSILGQLKIPGYSDYLHPYDENHLIGFGKDAVVVTDERYEKSPQPTDGTAYYQGMKISMFDVTDVSRPKELFQTVIGDRGTDSELLRNHKALLFSRDKNLLAFPVTVAEVPAGQKNNPMAYGQFAFQGAYVYHVDLQEGFRLRETVTHLGEDELKKAGGSLYESNHQIGRLLYIGDTLYSLSPGQIRAQNLETLAETGRLELP
ncbi:beta-propeller domain-containing protein [Paenibacillus mesotrionivorans]|uniref:Beta-propeller domain-containing protein n=1 Tax=Paenibacillus mesotrionivorans TaxID=3160968 RepID=A0ACC7P088_9BACL